MIYNLGGKTMDFQNISSADMNKFIELITKNEDSLIERILMYAKKFDYTKYTSTLKEAWRMSISGLSAALIKAAESNFQFLELGPDDDFTKKNICEFGIIEAQKHRSRGITFGMFMGLMKYYKQSYEDLIYESDLELQEKEFFGYIVKRYFDNIELGFSAEWTGLTKQHEIVELQNENRIMTNEKNKYLTIFESIGDPVIFIDTENKIENINKKAAELFIGQTVSGSNYYNTLDLKEGFKWIEDELSSFIDKKTFEANIEKTLETKIGKRNFIIKFKKMLDVSEKYNGAVIILSDITEKIAAQNKLEEQHKQLKITQTQLVQSEKMAGLGTLVAGIAHELNNPINYISLSSYSLEKNIKKFQEELLNLIYEADDETKEFLCKHFDEFGVDIKCIMEGSKKIKTIVEDLRTFSRLEESEKKEILIGEAINITVRIVQSQYKNNIGFNLDIPTNTKLMCYPSQLNQVFLNIIVNACQAILTKTSKLGDAFKDGEIKIIVEESESEIRLIFRDNGCGMSDETKQKIFEPFFTTKPVGQGTGLGLSVSFGIIKKHHGRIEVDSVENIGTTMTIILPKDTNL